MTTPQLFNLEPIYIGGQAVFVKFFAMQRNPGDPSRIEGTFTLMAGEGTLTLDALVGPPGPPGTAAPIMRPQYDSPITDVSDLPDPATLDDSDNGRGWYIDGAWHIWQNGEYHIVQGSIPGPPGITPDISISAELVDKGSPPVYGPIDVEESGTTTAPAFKILVPAVPGPEGPAGAIEAAADYDDQGTPSQVGDWLVKVNEDKWGPGTPTLALPQLWTIPEAGFLAHSGSEGRFLIGSIDIPARNVDHYLDVIGHVKLKRAALSTAQLEVEVRVGLTGVGTGETEPLFGLAPFDPSFFDVDQEYQMPIIPQYSDTGNPLRSISPDTAVGRIIAGDAVTAYVFVHKAGGAGGWVFATPGAHLRVISFPVFDG
jgi:hypothetical protein